MKNHILTVIILFGLLSSGYAQDKIITLNNDTIDCKIIKISDNTIYYEINIQGVKSSGKVDHNRIFKYIIAPERNPVLRKNTEVSKDPFAVSDTVPMIVQRYHTDNIKTLKEKKEIKKDPFNRLHLELNGGPGYLLGSTKTAEETMSGRGLSEDQVNSYYKDMKSGISANAALIFMITPYCGTGIKYKFFATSANMEGFIDTGDDYNLYYGKVGEHIYVNFTGATLLYQQFIGRHKAFKLNSASSLGFTTYRNEASFLYTSFLLTGKNIGVDLGIGLEYFISGNFSVGADLSFFYSSLSKMKLSDGYTTTTIDLEKDSYENLSRLDFSVGIRVYLWNK